MSGDLFIQRLAAVRERFAAKLAGRIDELEAAMPELAGSAAIETMARIHRRAHDLCGVGPTMGFVATGQAARQIEQVLLAALKANRGLNAEEIARIGEAIARLRAAARAEMVSPG